MYLEECLVGGVLRVFGLRVYEFPGFRVSGFPGSHEFSRLFLEKTELCLRRKSGNQTAKLFRIPARLQIFFRIVLAKKICNLAGMRKSLAGWFPARFFCNVFLIIPDSGYRGFYGAKAQLLL